MAPGCRRDVFCDTTLSLIQHLLRSTITTHLFIVLNSEENVESSSMSRSYLAFSLLLLFSFFPEDREGYSSRSIRYDLHVCCEAIQHVDLY